MIDVLLALGVLLFGAGITAVVYLAREQRISTPVVRALAAISAVGLLSMLLSDWPSEVLAEFWADHSVIAGILSTILLVGIVFLAFEDSERRHQEQLDGSVTAAGLGGMVDHVIDAEIALGLLSRSEPPAEWGWDQDGKPLRWLRPLREQCDRGPAGAPVPDVDPRSATPALPGGGPAEWRAELVDQIVRRLLAGIRDWTPVVHGSRNGTMVLIAIAQIRNDLVELGQALRDGSGEPVQLLITLRQRLRLLAHFMEVTSGAKPVRDEVLTTMDPLPLWSDDFDWASDPDRTATFGKAWQVQLQATMEEVNRHAPTVD